MAWKTTAVVAVFVCLAGGAGMATVVKGDPDIGHNREWAGQTFSDRPEAVLPFSFVYGGRPSSELVPHWQRASTNKRLDAGRFVRTLTLTDPSTGLEVEAVATLYTDTAGVDWTLQFTNRGASDTPILEDVKAVDITIPIGKPDAAVVLHRLNGGPCRVDDWMPFDQPLPVSQEIDFATTGGRSSNVCPFFNMSWGTGGVITAIGWSGQWAAGAKRGKDGDLRVWAGMERVHLKLRPGETIRGPRILQLRWTGDEATSYNQFRRTMLAHVLPRIDGRLVTPPITTPSPWAIQKGDVWKYIYGFAEPDAMDEIELLRGLGYEYYWTDAYYTRGNFPEGIGNYGLPLNEVVPDLKRWPHGLRPVSDAAHKDGMKYIVWFEPERVTPGTTIAKEHPRFVISPDGDGSGLLNLGLPEAREYITKVLNTAIDEWRMDCLRIDYNLDPLPYWHYLDAKDPDRVGMAEIRYVEGLYRMWDDIRRVNPHLFIDNCASGGRRIDLETCSRSIPLWRTDAVIGPYAEFNYDQTAIQNQVMTAGLDRYLPFSTSGSIGAKPYHFRSGFNYGVPIAERPRDEERELLKQGIAEGKRLRKYWLGDFYVLSRVTTDPKDWCVWQYHRPREQDGIIVAFRRQESPYSSFSCESIRGIDPDAEYLVTRSHSYFPEKAVRMKGAALKASGLAVPDRPGSVIVEYRKTR